MQNNILAAMSDFIINIFEDILERYMIIILDALNIIAEGYITIIQYVLKFIYSFVQYRNDQIKQFECYLGQYLKLSVNFVSMLIDELLDYFNSVIDEFKNLEMKNKLIISFLISMLVFLIIISLYYKRCIDLLNYQITSLKLISIRKYAAYAEIKIAILHYDHVDICVYATSVVSCLKKILDKVLVNNLPSKISYVQFAVKKL